MGSEPAIHIAIRVNDPAPAVFSTALGPLESERLSVWISTHPDLGDLVRHARALAEAETGGAEEVE
jgi:hypothetical protein